MAVWNVTLRECNARQSGPPLLSIRLGRWLAAALTGAVVVLQAAPAQAQFLPAKDCLSPGEPLIRIPELVSEDHKLRGTILLSDEQQRITFPKGCALQYVRFFRGIGAVPAPPPSGTFGAPLPGPTLRARVGDLVELTFLNQVDTGHYGDSIDHGENAGACDETSGSPGYPQSANDTFPNCFHGSSTGNIHFHGTHTNPNSTGDNVFLQIRPSPREGGKPTVTAESVKVPFEQFFGDCERELRRDVLSEWPHKWSDLPSSWTEEQHKLLDAYDHGTSPYSPPPKPEAQQLWPLNQKALDEGQWPQFYVGAYPYCFQLPAYQETVWPPVQAAHGGMPMAPPNRVLQMGQAPGTQWYHAHKHGSTDLDVSNGMTGAFIIEGRYDDDLNKFYATPEVPNWTRTQPVLVLNQFGVSTNLSGGSGFGGGGPPFSVNGRIQPKLKMRPGEVQLWRIVNTSSRSGANFVGFQNAAGQTANFDWKQLAQDGVQFAEVNYEKSEKPNFTMAAGNRVDLLVKAPADQGPQAQVYNVVVRPTIARTNLGKAVTLMTVEVSGTPATGPQSEFIPRAPAFPPFLADITDAEVKNKPEETLTFNSKGPGSPEQHTINGHQFDGESGVEVFLNVAEQWKIENTTSTATGTGNIDHPFHIHINPFQIIEVFDPNEMVKNAAGTSLIPKYVLGPVQDGTIQCSLNADDPDTWKDCHNANTPNRIWWDVFPIPSGRPATKTDKSSVVIPGYFRMRSRFVDYPGTYVLHCHILAHEDRGMMMVVEVRPKTLLVQHH